MAASPHDVETDAMLVFAAQDGDADAFSELFRRHYPTIRRTCARKLRDIREADEVAQAAFVRAYERLDRCTGDRRFGAWIQVIANNLCIDHMRATARTTPSEDPVTDLDSMPSENPPEDAVLQAEQAELIQRALATLSDRQRDVVVARDVDGRRPPEIAAALGLSLGAVDSLLLRARRRLAASVQSLSAESGSAQLTTTAAIATVGSTASQFEALARAVQSISDAVASASYHIAAGLGMVPGVPSVVQQVAPAAAAGLVALSPLAGLTDKVDVKPVVAPIKATVQAPTVSTSPLSVNVVPPSVTTPDTSTAPLVPVTEIKLPAPDAGRSAPAPKLVDKVGAAVDKTVDALLPNGPHSAE